MGKTITTVDIGSSKVCAVICGINRDDNLEILGMGMDSVKGIKKGVIKDILNVSSAVKNAVEQAEHMSGLNAERVYVNVSGVNSKIVKVKTRLDIKNEVTFEDVSKILSDAKNQSARNDYEVIGVEPVQYIADGYDGILDPVGMNCSILELESYVVMGQKTLIHNIAKSVENAGFDMAGYVTEALANFEFLLNEDEKETNIAIINVGGNVTDISVFRNKRLVFTEYIPVGGDHITSDIATLLNIPLADAEKIKRKYNLALTSLIKNDLPVSINRLNENKPKDIYASQIIEIIEARVYDLFEICKNHLIKYKVSPDKMSEIIVTGRGISNVDGGDLIVKKVFGVQSRIVSPKNIDIPGVEVITAYAMALYILKHKREDLDKKIEVPLKISIMKKGKNLFRKVFAKLF